MIYEHEIPSHSRLYFSKSAKVKREVESVISNYLLDSGYDEIVTPYFSYHQHKSIDEKSLVRFGDGQNHLLSLRADSTLDVVRIITKRLGRSVKQKKWFYVQPTFRYPSKEYYQIGAEYLENSDLKLSLHDAINSIKKLAIKPTLQISNIKIPQIISDELGLDIELFKSANLESIFRQDIKWLSQLASCSSKKHIEGIMDDIPEVLRGELEKLINLTDGISYKSIVIAPLFYSKMRYYDDLFFRFFEQNNLIGMGGNYRFETIDATGFALYIDNIIEGLIKDDKNS